MSARVNPHDGASIEAKSFFTPGHDPIRPDEMHGRVRMVYFTHDETAITNGNTIVANKLPKGARILHGRVSFGTGGTDRVLDIGLTGVDESGNIEDDGPVADDLDLLADGIDAAAAGEADFANDDASGMGYRTAKEVYLTITAGGDDWPAGQHIHGYLLYVLD